MKLHNIIIIMKEVVVVEAVAVVLGEVGVGAEEGVIAKGGDEEVRSVNNEEQVEKPQTPTPMMMNLPRDRMQMWNNQ
jgi:hypothetical protein